MCWELYFVVEIKYLLYIKLKIIVKVGKYLIFIKWLVKKCWKFELLENILVKCIVLSSIKFIGYLWEVILLGELERLSFSKLRIYIMDKLILNMFIFIVYILFL